MYLEHLISWNQNEKIIKLGEVCADSESGKWEATDAVLMCTFLNLSVRHITVSTPHGAC